jgi:hypothetical protein
MQAARGSIHGLRTRYRSGRGSSPEVRLRRQNASAEILRRCAEHGVVRWVLNAEEHYRCTKCRSEGVRRRRRRIKEILVGSNCHVEVEGGITDLPID